MGEGVLEMMRERKIWGERWLIRQDSTHAVSFLKLEKDTFCSWHKHQAKFNLFVVLRGRVGIVTEQFGGSAEVVLGPGECLTVKPGDSHKFVVYEPSEMIEEMFVQYDEGDIERETVGGKL
jgi:mannose-6-phosphate isomerase-like protein (cupin superfamily)